MWGSAPSLLMSSKFGRHIFLANVINRAKFGVDQFSIFGTGEVQTLPSPIGLTSGPYHTAALPCLQVIIILSHSMESGAPWCDG